VVLLFLSAGCQQASDVTNFGKRAVEVFSGRTPVNAAKQMEDQYFPDERRQGVAKLTDRDFGRREPYTDRYRQIAQYDSDWLVRATAIRALNRSRDGKATPIFIKALSDQNETVRIEAAKGLGNMPDKDAVPALIRLVANPEENRDVRIWAADALRHYQTLEVARTLANQLQGREFSVAWQSRKSLIVITGQDHFYDEGAWLQYFTGPDKPFG
jgi:hypothetical protein